MFPIIGSHKQKHEVQAWEMFRKHLLASCFFILGGLPGARLIRQGTATAAIYRILPKGATVLPFPTFWQIFFPLP